MEVPTGVTPLMQTGSTVIEPMLPIPSERRDPQKASKGLSGVYVTDRDCIVGFVLPNFRVFPKLVVTLTYYTLRLSQK